MHTPKHRSIRSDKLSDTLQDMGQSLERLVDLGESVLGVLKQSAATLDAQAGSQPAQATNPRSVRRSTRSENVIQPDVIDLAREDVISFALASAMIPTHPSVSTISRWCSLGCRGLKLESVLIGGRRKTTQQSISRFLIACSERNFAGMEGNISLLRNQVMAVKERLAEQRRKDGTEQLSLGLTLPNKAQSARTRRGASRNKDSSTRSKRPRRASERHRR